MLTTELQAIRDELTAANAQVSALQAASQELATELQAARDELEAANTETAALQADKQELQEQLDGLQQSGSEAEEEDGAMRYTTVLQDQGLDRVDAIIVRYFQTSVPQGQAILQARPDHAEVSSHGGARSLVQPAGTPCTESMRSNATTSDVSVGSGSRKGLAK